MLIQTFIRCTKSTLKAESEANISGSIIARAWHDFIPVVMHLSWKRLGLNIWMAWHCLVTSLIMSNVINNHINAHTAYFTVIVIRKVFVVSFITVSLVPVNSFFSNFSFITVLSSVVVNFYCCMMEIIVIKILHCIKACVPATMKLRLYI